MSEISILNGIDQLTLLRHRLAFLMYIDQLTLQRYRKWRSYNMATNTHLYVFL